MYSRLKKTGKYKYLQICRSISEGKKVKQQVVAKIGHMDQLEEKGEIEKIVRSLARYSEKVLMILGGENEPSAVNYKIGPSLIFERLWKESGIKTVIKDHLQNRKYTFSAERALFLTVLNRLLISGSDRNCNRWRRDYRIPGTKKLQLHHLYRAMGWLGEKLTDQKDASDLGPRCTKDLIEESLFKRNRDLFSSLDLVFFDTTSIYFEGQGGESLGKLGNSKDHRSDLNQMVVGAVLDNNGRPISCEMWEGNTADVSTLIPVVDRLKKRFSINNFCVVADRGMISNKTITSLEERSLSYILGVRMRKVKQARLLVASNQDISTYEEVYPESEKSKAPAPLKVKEVTIDDRRYILCYNSRQARKDSADRESVLESLRKKIKSNAGSLIGNKGYRKYLKIDKEGVTINEEKINSEQIFDGKWVLQSNLNWPARDIALKYKELWQVEHVFRYPAYISSKRLYEKRSCILQFSGISLTQGIGQAFGRKWL